MAAHVALHLRVLRDAGFVVATKAAQRRLYHLQPTALRAIDDWLDRYRHLWSRRLDNLEQHMGTMEKEEKS